MFLLIGSPSLLKQGVLESFLYFVKILALQTYYPQSTWKSILNEQLF